VSWLELELHALGELAAAATARVAAHLDECAACRACLERIHGDQRTMPALVVPATRVPRPFWTRWRIAWSLAGAAVAAAAVLLVVLRGGDTGDQLAIPGRRAHLKGGAEVTVSLVRDRAGAITHDPRDFRDGDAFQLLVTCPFGDDTDADLAVFQGGRAFFPTAAGHVDCGNQVVFPAAFHITGDQPATVCVTFAPIDRSTITRVRDLPAPLTACLPLSPVP